MMRTYIEEALAGQFLAADCAENLVRLAANLRIELYHLFVRKKMGMMIPEASTWW